MPVVTFQKAVIPAGYEAVNEEPEVPATTIVEPQPVIQTKDTNMSFKSVLDDMGSKLKTFFTGAAKVVTVVVTDLDKAALVAEPFVDAAFPGAASMYNITVAAVGTAEASAIAAGAQTGTGPQKLALVISSIENSFNAYWKGLGNTASPTQTQIETYVNGVVATLTASGSGNAAPPPPASGS